MSDSELKALIALLDDPDKEVFNAVSESIISHGTNVVSILEKAWETSSGLTQQRIESLIHSIQLNSTMDNITKWVEMGAHDLLEGAFYLSLYQYPEIEYKAIDKAIEKIRKDIWVELNENLTALEKVKIINHIFFEIHGFSGNTSNFFAPQNCYINQVIESKKGGPIALTILYATLAQRLGLPVYPVNLPKNFILAYKDRFKSSMSNPLDSILFYINPFNKGAVLGYKEIEYFLKQQNVEISEEYFLPCSNQVSISQLISSLSYSYEKMGNQDKVHDLNLIQKIVS